MLLYVRRAFGVFENFFLAIFDNYLIVYLCKSLKVLTSPTLYDQSKKNMSSYEL